MRSTSDPPRPSDDRRWWTATVVLVIGYATALVVQPTGTTWHIAVDVVLYDAVLVVGVLAALGAARRARHERVAWYGVAFYCASTALADLAWSVLAATGYGEGPSFADLIYLTGYLGLYTALIGLIKARVARFHPSMWLDGIIGGFGAAAIAVVVVLEPWLSTAATDTTASLLALAYPLVDVVQVAVLVGVAAVLGVRRDATLVTVGLGLLANLASDLAYLHQSAAGTYSERSLVDLGWLLAVAALTRAAVRATGAPAVATAESATRVGWRVMVLPLTSNAISLALLGAGWGDRLPPMAAWCAVACVLAGLCRTAVTFHEVRSFHEVREQAYTDELTGLDNRRAFLVGAAGVVATATAQRPAALLLLDLDRFKEVNDGLGHAAGDQLLRVVAGRLRAGARPGDLMARLGGDEFAVVLPDTDLDTAVARAGDLKAALTDAVTVDGMRLHVGVSIGIATCPVPADSVTELLRCADVAMYAAKSARAGVRVYVADPSVAPSEALQSMDDVHTALDDGHLDVHLQPQLDLRTGRVVGAEALLRWNHPQRGLLPPADVLFAAEHAGLLPQVVDRVLDRSLAATAGWWADHRVPVSINFSATDIADPALLERVLIALDRYGLPTEALTVEVVEDDLMADVEVAGVLLQRLRRVGIGVSIDDYGTGYSSLAYLARLPADELKLDRSLVRDLVDYAAGRAVVRHTIALAHDLGLHLVAEGVEDQPTADLLRELGCDRVQGWAVARAMPAPEFIRWLDQHTGPPRIAPPLIDPATRPRRGEPTPRAGDPARGELDPQRRLSTTPP